MCFLSQNSNQISPFNPTASEKQKDPILAKIPSHVTQDDLNEKFRIASLSKIITSHWAVNKLGPEFRFTTNLYILPNRENLGQESQNQKSRPNCRIHVEGSMDPYMGREMLSRIFSQVKPKLLALNCASVSGISYDENFQVLLNALSHQKNHTLSWQNPRTLFNPEKTHSDFSAFLRSRSGLNGDFSGTTLIEKSQFEQIKKRYVGQFKLYSVRSRPLYMMLKDMNMYSFNYAADVLFEKLGGRGEYMNFISKRLHFDRAELELQNGSGYPVVENSTSKYNLVTCAAFVAIIKDLDLGFKSYRGHRTFQLADILATGGPGEDYSTFKKLYAGQLFDRTLVAKTGTAERAVTFGGMLSLPNQNLYFAVLTAPDSFNGGDLNRSRNYIHSLVTALAERQQLKQFKYEYTGTMEAFDEFSTLREESLELKNPPLYPSLARTSQNLSS